MDKKMIDKIREGRQYRPISESFRIATRKEGEASEEMIVEGHAATFNQPYTLYDDGEWRVDEQIDVHAFDECDMDDVIFQYNHEGRVFARTRNSTLEVKTDEIGLWCRADLSGTAAGRELFEEIKNGYTDRMSFGFTIKEDKWEETYNRVNHTTLIKRTITKVGKLYDVSAVSIPANDGTDISARSFCDGVIAEIKAERLGREKIEALKAECLELLGVK